MGGTPEVRRKVEGWRVMRFWWDTIRRLPGDRSERVVSGGRVFCPIVGDRDVEACVGCPSLREARLNDVPATLRCSAVHDPVTLERMAFLGR